MPFLSDLGDWFFGTKKVADTAAKKGWLGQTTQEINKPDPIMGPVNDSLDRIRQSLGNSIDTWQQKSQQQYPSTEDIFARLQALQDPSRYMQGYGDLQAQANAQASAQYDPVIAQLRSQMQNASTRANRYKGEIGDMFSALSSNLEGDIPKVQQTYEQTKGNTQGVYDQLQQSISNQYNQSMGEQEAMMKRLGIEAAASDPQNIQRQQRDRDYFLNRAKTDSATQQSALNTQEQGAVDYTRQGSQIARSEGTSRQANLMSQLQEMLNQYEGQIGANETAKQQASHTALFQLQQQLADRAQKSAQQDFTNYLNTMQLGRQMRNDEFNQSKVKAPGAVKSPADVASRVMGMGVSPDSAQSIQNTFMNAVGNDDLIKAGIDPGSGANMSKEALAARIVEQGRQQGLSQQEINALQIAALEYFGRG